MNWKEIMGMGSQDSRLRLIAAAVIALAAIAPATATSAESGALRVHNIFRSNMVIQRDKPITIWGWAQSSRKVSVQFGEAKAEATAGDETGRWEVTFPARQANAAGQKLTVTSGDETIEMDNILVGDIWVMNGQSNMAFGLGATFRADMETATAHLPLLRRVGISPNESYTLQKDLPADRISGWTVCTPETAGGFSSIGYSFASRLQRALQIPIGFIDNARGGAAIESLVPRHKFNDDPLAATSMLVMLGIVALGAAADPATGRAETEWWAMPHMFGAMLGTAWISLSFVMQFNLIRANFGVIADVMRQVESKQNAAQSSAAELIG